VTPISSTLLPTHTHGQARGFAIRNGHAYAHRLMTALAPALLPYLERSGTTAGGGGGQTDDAARAVVDDGVVRISLLHYNTHEEVDGLLSALQELL
jgi:selenocysteine lyase/cysteine desulfurase